MLVSCPQCNEPREVTRDRGKLCRTCTTNNSRSRNWTPLGYKQSCIDCNKVWLTKADTKAERCVNCSGLKLGREMAKNNIKEESEKVRYKVVCSSCGVKRLITTNPTRRKTDLCGKCSRSYTGKSNKKHKESIEKEVELTVKQKLNSLMKRTGKLFRYCPSCPSDSNTIEVSTKEESGIKYCNEHKPNKPKTYSKTKVQKKKEKYYPSQAIEKIREQNRKHKESVENNKVFAKLDKATEEECDDMISNWLEKNKPSIEIKHNEPFPHLSYGMNIQGY